MSANSPKPFKDLLGLVVKTETEYFAVGGYGELWKGEMTHPDGSTTAVYVAHSFINFVLIFA